jgi:diguanylate cyclase (GGDEF)-like protein
VQVQVQDGPGRPDRVLLVENDPRAAMMLGEMLRAAWTRGLVISHAEALADAAQELLDHGATCVLVSLPHGPAATQAVAQLSAASPDTPIVVLSDHADEETGLAVVRAGAQDYLLKAELNATMLGRSMRYAVQRKRAEAALALRALHDSLTTLPNRALFLDRVRVALDRSRRTGSPVVVLFLDVDGFKQINDSLGHSAGDQLLTALAGRFQELLRPMDTVARFGGDEFTFLFEGLETDLEATVVAQRISRFAGAPMELGGEQHSISVSIGVTIITDPETEIDDVIRQADIAMYRAKGFGGARWEVFDGRLGMTPVERSNLEIDLGQAVSQSQLRVHYQPRVSLHAETGLEGFEALVRWQHPERGLIEPVDFIPIAEESGLIVAIGEWVIDQALAQVKRWRESRPGVTISVNLSSRQLGDPGLVDRLTTVMRDGHHDPSVLCLEVAEGALEAAPELAASQLAALNKLGIKLAIDNFGTAVSSSVSLPDLPVDILKIDQTLISRLGDGNGGVQSVSAVVQLGHTLGLSVVAEGVETDAQLAQLRDLGCDGAQGYLISAPMSEEGVRELLGDR